MTSDKGISAKTLTLILAVGEGKTLYPLTRTRPQPLVSYGGIFRIIDFTLSNCWNSGIRRAFVLTDYQHWLTERYLDSLDDCISQWCADSVDSYYWSQIELLLRNSSFDLYTDDSWPIFGAEVERPISLLRDKSKGTSSIISTNARVHGADISHCIISQNVDIAPGTRVESSILFKSVRVGQGARIRKAIIDENVRIPDRAIIGYDPETDRQHFVVTKTGVVVVDRDAIHRFNATRKATAGKSVAA